jgi:hypothetical protein
MSAVQVRLLDTTIGSGAAEEGGGPLSHGLILSNRFDVDIDDPAVPYRIRMTVCAFEGRLGCESLTVERRPHGPVVVGSGLRSVVIDGYLTRVRQELEHQPTLLLRRDVERSERAVRWRGANKAERTALARSAPRRDPVQVTDVAVAYRRALASPDPELNRAPTVAVAAELGISRGHAARLVARARQEGHLAPARPGRGGEYTAAD